MSAVALDHRLLDKNAGVRHEPPSQPDSLLLATSVPGDYFSTLRLRQLSFVPDRPRSVLEVGCGAGTALAYLKARGAGRVVGIEPHTSAAAAARENPAIDQVIEAEAMTALASIATESIEVVIASHVLEHLQDPWAAMAEIRRVIVPGGVLVGALPNVRYLPVTLRLLVRGRFDYTDSGVLDRTHLRFFTRSSIVALIEGSAFTLTELAPDYVARSRMQRLHTMTFGLLRHHCAYAYDFCAVK